MNEDVKSEFEFLVKRSRNIRNFGAVIAVAGPIGPLAINWALTSPLWPEASGHAAAFWTLGTYVIELVVFLFLIFRWKNRKKTDLLWWLKYGCLGSLLFLMAFLFVQYIYLYPIEGWGYSRTALDRMARHPDWTVWQLLEAFGNDETRAFTPAYLALMRLGFLLMAFSLFGAITFMATIAALIERKDKETKKGAERP